MWRFDIFATAASAIVLLSTISANAWTLTTRYNFQGTPDGAGPTDGLTYFSGNLYGTANLDGNGYGNVFAFGTSTNAETVIYNFQSGSDGAYPDAAPIAISTNTLYGTTYDGGGTANYGTLFSLDPSTNTETVLYRFKGGSDGANPYARLIAINGVLYGTTSAGGTANYGTVFSLNLSTKTETVFYKFKGGSDGKYPFAPLLEASTSTLYGTTDAGGSTANYGTVFEVNLSTKAESVIYRFHGGSDGAYPIAGLTYNAQPLGERGKGNLYGTTTGGGNSNCVDGCGTVFTINPATDTETVLYRFSGYDGYSPHSQLQTVQPNIYSYGDLYGTTFYGGNNYNCPDGCGTVFELVP